MSSLVTALAFPRSTISIKGIPLFHFENAFLAKEAPRLTRSILDAVHYRMFAVAVRTGLGFAHGSQAWLHILEPFVGKKVDLSKREIPKGRPSRTEAEHPRQRFGLAGFTPTWQDYVAVIALFSVLNMLTESNEGTLVGLKFGWKKQPTHESSENSNSCLPLLCKGFGLFSN